MAVAEAPRPARPSRARRDRTSAAVRRAENLVRKELARELHDTVAQTLTTMVVAIEHFKADQAGRATATRQLEELQRSTITVLQQIRTVLGGLREEVIELSFVELVGRLVSEVARDAGFEAELSVAAGWEETMPADSAAQLLRIVEQALVNARDHSGAETVQVRLASSPDYVEVTIVDDGRGFDSNAPRRAGVGLLGMRERAVLAGGDLRVESRPAQGTRIMVVVPRRIPAGGLMADEAPAQTA